ncbi:MAG TPA: hypothetical protein VJ785_17515 [Anaerolineales bacterium]|nr:hypothetical protein [Anaerolineales bacterium]
MLSIQSSDLIIDIFYWIVVIYYSIYVTVGVLILIKQAVVKVAFWFRDKRWRIRNRSRNKKRKKFAELFEVSTVFNDILAILSLVTSFYILSVIPISRNTQWLATPFIAMIIPYAWGFYRATGVGLRGGVIGAVIGSHYLAQTDLITPWNEKIPYLIVIAMVANASGWLGGFLGRGQLKEAIALNLYDLALNKSGNEIEKLIAGISGVIDGTYSKLKGEIRTGDNKLNAIVAQLSEENRASLVSFSSQADWKKVYRPQLIALGWLFSTTDVSHSADEVFDSISNFFRFTTTEVIISYVREPLDVNNIGRIRIIVKTFKQTPSIIWVDKDIHELSDQLDQEIRSVLNQHNNKARPYWEVIYSSSLILRQWREKPTLEQYAKNTFAVTNPIDLISKSQLYSPGLLPSYNNFIEYLIGVPSFFDKIRGQLYAFFAFLIGQILLGIFINWASVGLGP